MNSEDSQCEIWFVFWAIFSEKTSRHANEDDDEGEYEEEYADAHADARPDAYRLPDTASKEPYAQRTRQSSKPFCFLNSRSLDKKND